MLYPPKPVAGGSPSGALFARLVSSPEWVCEAKRDGIRCLVWAGAQPSSMSRTGRPRELPVGAATALRRCPWDVRLDVEEKDGMLWVFDAPDMPGGYWTRHKWLVRCVVEIGSGLVQVMPVLEQPDPWAAVLSNGWEGCVFKRTGAAYDWATRPGGTTRDWIKFRR